MTLIATATIFCRKCTEYRLHRIVKVTLSNKDTTVLKLCETCHPPVKQPEVKCTVSSATLQ